MDEVRFDSVVKDLVSSAGRRSLLGGGLAAVLTGTLMADATAGKKKNNCGKGKQKCKGKCISKSKCCKDKDCQNGGVCQDGSCTCGAGSKLCGTTCIPAANCCNSSDCVGAKAGTCDSGTCIAGFQICTKPGAVTPVTPGTANVTDITGSDSPMQSGNSARFSVGSDGRDWAHLRSALFAGVTLNQLEQLRYTTYVPTGGNCSMAPYMALYVSSPGGGDDILLLDPGIGEATPPICGSFQTWNARAGGWRSIFHGDFSPQLNPKSLDAYQAQFGVVTLRNQNPGASDCPTVFGGLRLEAGENNPADPTGGWQNFVGFIDSLEIKLAGQEKQVFNF